MDTFALECLVLTSDTGQRIEMHIRCDADGIATLFAFSGQQGQLPTRDLQQGPFQSRDQAIGARRVIAARLLSSGFQVCDTEAAIWEVPLQRQLNHSRRLRDAATVDCRFDPKDVYLDW